MKASVRNAVYADSITTPMCVMLWWRQLCVLVAILLVSCVWDVRYRRNSQLQDLRDVGGGFNKLNYFIGRPRIRQVRSEPCGKDDALDLHTAFEELRQPTLGTERTATENYLKNAISSSIRISRADLCS